MEQALEGSAAGGDGTAAGRRGEGELDIGEEFTGDEHGGALIVPGGAGDDAVLVEAEAGVDAGIHEIVLDGIVRGGGGDPVAVGESGHSSGAEVRSPASGAVDIAEAAGDEVCGPIGAATEELDEGGQMVRVLGFGVHGAVALRPVGVGGGVVIHEELAIADVAADEAAVDEDHGFEASERAFAWISGELEAEGDDDVVGAGGLGAGALVADGELAVAAEGVEGGLHRAGGGIPVISEADEGSGEDEEASGKRAHVDLDDGTGGLGSGYPLGSTIESHCPRGKMKYEESSLYCLRHSAAHLLAQALTELYPGVKLSIGPPVENGFYYDVDLPEGIKEEDLGRIEQKMRELANLKQPITVRAAKDRDEAKSIILGDGTFGQGEETALYKLQLLDAIPDGDAITFYEQRGTDKQGNEHYFIDLCRGPHIEHTGTIKHFKLMSIAGAYWRGDVRNKMLTRIYGTAFETKEELETYLHNLEEAKKRDHRILGRQLGLFIFSERIGQGLPVWLPKGTLLRQALTDFLHSEQVKRGYQGVVTPNIGNSKLWDKSGHTLNYKDKMFPFMEDGEDATFILKPMNCPFHIEIYASELRSYRDLPVRLAEFGTVYRYEQSGELAGMLRVRGFTQDDAHLFVRPDQLLEEFKGVVDLMMTVLNKLGLTEYRVRVGTRDPGDTKYVGHDENWELSERAIVQACDELGLAYELSPGDAAFYGPKLDLVIKDALGREWQMGTVQVDYNLPERFEITYVGEDSKPHRPIMIHRAPFGSLERMIGLLTEQYAGAFPFWLSPTQVAVLPIADRHNAYAYAIAEALQGFPVRKPVPEESVAFGALGVDVSPEYRVHVDDRRETLNKKIRENQQQKVPYMLIVGDRDAENGTVGVRSREEGDLGAMPLAAFLARISGS